MNTETTTQPQAETTARWLARIIDTARDEHPGHPDAAIPARLTIADVVRLHREITNLDRGLDDTLSERDRATDAADRLAYAIAPVEVIGEHCGDNDPWTNALEVIAQQQAELAAWQERESADAAAGSYALRAETAEAERDELRQRISNARAEIRRQEDLGDGELALNALEKVEAHLVDPEHRPKPAASCGHARGMTIGGRCAECTAVPEMPETQPARHFSPGYEGEIPDHHGPADTCAMPACVTARAQHEAVADIQDLTYRMFAEQDTNGGEQ